MDERKVADLNRALDRLRAASLDASKGTAYTCGAPWFRNGSGVLVGSPDPHAGQMIADTDTSLLDPDNHAEIDDDRNAIFLAAAWNFARLILGSPEMLDCLRATGAGRSEAEAGVKIPAGWKLVPIVPTTEMRSAMARACTLGWDIADNTWDMGIRRSPRPPAIRALPAHTTGGTGE